MLLVTFGRSQSVVYVFLALLEMKSFIYDYPFYKQMMVRLCNLCVCLYLGVSLW